MNISAQTKFCNHKTTVKTYMFPVAIILALALQIESVVAADPTCSTTWSSASATQNGCDHISGGNHPIDCPSQGCSSHSCIEIHSSIVSGTFIYCSCDSCSPGYYRVQLDAGAGSWNQICSGSGGQPAYTCKPCSAGTYSSGGTTTSCSPCSASMYSDSAASSCSPCPDPHTLSAAGSAISGCYIQSGTTGTDTKGTFKYDGACYYPGL